jgi:hypothetical protein
MALGSSDIQYFDVDASESTPQPRSKNYRTMHVPVIDQRLGFFQVRLPMGEPEPKADV